MKKKHYELIGAEIKKIFIISNEDKYVKELAINLSEVFRNTSPTFNKEMFLKTCGIETNRM